MCMATKVQEEIGKPEMDLLQMDTQELYFDKPLPEAVAKLIDAAAEAYGEHDGEDEGAEELLKAALDAQPDHPVVHVALYRYYYYQHRLADALGIADRTLEVCGRELGFDGHWSEASLAALKASKANMAQVRYYLLALKGAGFICLRMGRWEEGEKRLKKVIEMDSEDRMGAAAVLQVVEGWDS